jgi:hypothetical protein
MTISKKHLHHVCMVDNGSQTCRYLYNDDLDNDKWYCQKLRPIEKNKIDEDLQVFLKDCKKRKINPKKLEKPQGDNCKGFILLKNIKQGYDC